MTRGREDAHAFEQHAAGEDDAAARPFFLGGGVASFSKASWGVMTADLHNTVDGFVNIPCAAIVHKGFTG